MFWHNKTKPMQTEDKTDSHHDRHHWYIGYQGPVDIPPTVLNTRDVKTEYLSYVK